MVNMIMYRLKVPKRKTLRSTPRETLKQEVNSEVDPKSKSPFIFLTVLLTWKLESKAPGDSWVN